MGVSGVYRNWWAAMTALITGLTFDAWVALGFVIGAVALLVYCIADYKQIRNL